jgi:hypothetical protein
MSTRILPLGLVGSNINVLATGVPNYIDAGFTMFATDNGGTKISVKTLGFKGSSTITVASATGIKIGQFVTGVNVPAFDASANPVVVSGINGTQITLSSTLLNNIDQGYVNFYTNVFSIEYQLEAMVAAGVESLRFALPWDQFEKTPPINGVHTYNWQTGGEKFLYNLDAFMYLATKVGIKLMPRFSVPPSWEKDWDYRLDTANPFSYRDPRTDYNSLPYQGVMVTATGSSGSNTVTVADVNRGFMILPKMIVSGTGFQSNTKVVSVIKQTNNYTVTLDKPLTQNVGGLASPVQTYNMIAGIQNFYENNYYNNSNNLVYTTKTVTNSSTTSDVITLNNTTNVYAGFPVTGTGIPANTTISAVLLNNKVVLSNMPTATLETITIQTNAKKLIASNVSDQFVFETLDDFNLFLIHLRRKGGGGIPKNNNNFVLFVNKVINRYGTNGDFWNETTWNGKANVSNWSVISTTANWILSTSIPPKEVSVITVTNAADLVVGMIIKQDPIPTNQNNAYIKPNTKITAINGKQITLSNSINQVGTATSVAIKATYPRPVDWQIYNELNLLGSNNGYTISAKIKQGSGWTNRTFCYDVATATNWPQHRYNETVVRTVKKIANITSASASLSGSDVVYTFDVSNDSNNFLNFYKVGDDISINGPDNASGYAGTYTIRSFSPTSGTPKTAVKVTGTNNLLPDVTGVSFDACRVTTKTQTLLDEKYSWGPTIIDLVEKIKLEAHSADPNANIVLGAMAEGTDKPYISYSKNNIETISQDSPYQVIFDSKLGNGKNKFDTFSGNTYRTAKSGDSSDSYRMVANIVQNLLHTIIEPHYFVTSLPEVQKFPNYIVSEFGSPSNATDSRQNQYIGPFFQSDLYASTGDNKTTKGLEDLVNSNDSRLKNWTVQSTMNLKWANDDTNGYDKGVENLRGIINYKNTQSDTNNTDIKTGTISGSGTTLTFSSSIPSTWAVNSNIFATGTIPNFPSKGVLITAKTTYTITIATALSSAIPTTSLSNSNYVSCLYYFNPRPSAKIFQDGGSGYSTGALDLQGRK